MWTNGFHIENSSGMSKHSYLIRIVCTEQPQISPHCPDDALALPNFKIVSTICSFICIFITRRLFASHWVGGCICVMCRMCRVLRVYACMYVLCWVGAWFLFYLLLRSMQNYFYPIRTFNELLMAFFLFNFNELYLGKYWPLHTFALCAPLSQITTICVLQCGNKYTDKLFHTHSFVVALMVKEPERPHENAVSCNLR